MSHITVNKRSELAIASKSERVFGKVQELADEINMKVNNKKTQMLCIHASNFSNVRSYIRTDDDDIVPGDTLKILGFNFSCDPSANYHVLGVIDKLYSKLWTLRFLKRSEMSEERLFVCLCVWKGAPLVRAKGGVPSLWGPIFPPLGHGFASVPHLLRSGAY